MALTIDNLCTDVNECALYFPCSLDRVCVNLPNGRGYECRCKDDDPDCDTGFIVSKASLVMGTDAIIIIIVSILVLILSKERLLIYFSFLPSFVIIFPFVSLFLSPKFHLLLFQEPPPPPLVHQKVSCTV